MRTVAVVCLQFVFCLAGCESGQDCSGYKAFYPLATHQKNFLAAPDTIRIRYESPSDTQDLVFEATGKDQYFWEYDRGGHCDTEDFYEILRATYRGIPTLQKF